MKTEKWTKTSTKPKNKSKINIYIQAGKYTSACSFKGADQIVINFSNHIDIVTSCKGLQLKPQTTGYYTTCWNPQTLSILIKLPILKCFSSASDILKRICDYALANNVKLSIGADDAWIIKYWLVEAKEYNKMRDDLLHLRSRLVSKCIDKPQNILN